jgi:hypothetical protein
MLLDNLLVAIVALATSRPSFTQPIIKLTVRPVHVILYIIYALD